jgi:hypothetical protein
MVADDGVPLRLESQWDIALTRGRGWPYMPQTARLEETVLIVQRRHRVRSCDLVTAARVAVESRWYGRHVRQLTALADRGDRRRTPIDWSFRTDPRGIRARQQKREQDPDIP